MPLEPTTQPLWRTGQLIWRCHRNAAVARPWFVVSVKGCTVIVAERPEGIGQWRDTDGFGAFADGWRRLFVEGATAGENRVSDFFFSLTVPEGFRACPPWAYTTDANGCKTGRAVPDYQPAEVSALEMLNRQLAGHAPRIQAARWRSELDHRPHWDWATERREAFAAEAAVISFIRRAFQPVQVAA